MNMLVKHSKGEHFVNLQDRRKVLFSLEMPLKSACDEKMND